MIAICQECEKHHPVIADACHSCDKCHKMPVAEGAVKGEAVNVLRDTGCSTVVVRRSLVPDDKLTGREELVSSSTERSAAPQWLRSTSTLHTTQEQPPPSV